MVKMAWFRNKIIPIAEILLLVVCSYVAASRSNTWDCPENNGRVRINEKNGFIIDSHRNYTLDSKCTWLIEAKRSEWIYLKLEHFSTECDWDHLYIWDGNSVESSLLATYSGDLHDFDKDSTSLIAKSGFALIHFYSDAAYASTGFNISFNICDKSSDCPGFASKFANEIGCDSSFTCVKQGFCANQHCICPTNHSGLDCSGRGYWSNSFRSDITVSDSLSGWKVSPQTEWLDIPRTASHALAQNGEEVYLFPGETFTEFKPMSKVYRYNLRTAEWETHHSLTTTKPAGRYGYSAVWYNNQNGIYLYGGVVNGSIISNELWLWALDLKMFVQVEPQSCSKSDDLARVEASAEMELSNDVEGTFSQNIVDRLEGNTEDPFVASAGTTQPGGHACSAPLPSTGHTAHVVEDRLIVIFGYGGSKQGFIPYIQEFHPSNHSWIIIRPHGAIVKGSFGHASVWDEFTKLIYISGGVNQINNRISSISSKMLSYNPISREMRILKSMPTTRVLHAGVSFGNGLLMFFGGNPHSQMTGNKCFASKSLTFDTKCQRWEEVNATAPDALYATSPARYGHSAVLFENEVYLFGGFRGTLLSDVTKFTPADCRFARTKNECYKTLRVYGVLCNWIASSDSTSEYNALVNGKCVGVGSKADYDKLDCDTISEEFIVDIEKLREIARIKQQKPSVFRDKIPAPNMCKGITNCHSCLSNDFGCHWCSSPTASRGVCTTYPCKQIHSLTGNHNANAIQRISNCPAEDELLCSLHGSCQSCMTNDNNPKCLWTTNEQGQCTIERAISSKLHPPSVVSEGEFQKHLRQFLSKLECDEPCESRDSCVECTMHGSCMWCASENRCVDSSVYLVSFPYGQCKEWSTMLKKCDAMLRCEELRSCESCLSNPECGWCDDGSLTGLGRCHAGGEYGSKNASACISQRWHFVDCPTCNCNGHSICSEEKFCGECNNHTVGEQCEKCEKGFYGDPRNGGSCKSCECPERLSNGCDARNGGCKCKVKGLKGHACDRCDSENRYYGNPAGNKTDSTCFYKLATGYQFTFNMSKEEDMLFEHLNFFNSPDEKGLDLRFVISCTNFSFVNVTVRSTEDAPEAMLIENLECSNETETERIFASTDLYPIGEKNTTFFVWVKINSSPLMVKVSFVLVPALDLVQFFLVFSSCFVLLLVVAAALWKVKQRIDLYRRRQRMFVEMEALAKRPCANFDLELNDRKLLLDAVDRRDIAAMEMASCNEYAGSSKRKIPAQKCLNIMPISIEPLKSEKHAVVSTLILLPFDKDTGYTPKASSPLTIGSTLTSISGSIPRKVSPSSASTSKPDGGGSTIFNRCRTRPNQNQRTTTSV